MKAVYIVKVLRKKKKEPTEPMLSGKAKVSRKMRTEVNVRMEIAQS